MHIPVFNLYPTQRTTNIFSYYFLLVIDTAEEGDNEIRGGVSIIICGRSLVWTLKPFGPFTSLLNLTSSLDITLKDPTTTKQGHELTWPSEWWLFLHRDLVWMYCLFLNTVIRYNPIDYDYLITLTYRVITLMFSQGIQLRPMLEKVSYNRWTQQWPLAPNEYFHALIYHLLHWQGVASLWWLIMCSTLAEMH